MALQAPVETDTRAIRHPSRDTPSSCFNRDHSPVRVVHGTQLLANVHVANSGYQEPRMPDIAAQSQYTSTMNSMCDVTCCGL